MKIRDFSKWKLFRIKLKAMQIRKSVKVIDPFYIAAKNNIDVSFIDMEHPYAFKTLNPQTNTYTIYISNLVDKYSSKILCAHELGHIFCEGPAEVSLFDHKIDPVSEYIANTFAAMLVPYDVRFKISDDTTIEDFNAFTVNQIYLKKTS